VCFPNDPSLCKHHVIVQSAPFGLITNTCQEEELFAKVFIEDLRCWKSISTSPLPLISNTITSEVTPVNLTITDIVDSIRRYFIHKTGIQPKQWIMPCIEKELSAIYSKYQSLPKVFVHKVQNDFFTKSYRTTRQTILKFHFLN